MTMLAFAGDGAVLVGRFGHRTGPISSLALSGALRRSMMDDLTYTRALFDHRQ